jgi:hypothetical protein
MIASRDVSQKVEEHPMTTMVSKIEIGNHEIQCGKFYNVSEEVAT